MLGGEAAWTVVVPDLVTYAAMKRDPSNESRGHDQQRRGEATWQAETEGARTWTKTGSRVDDSWAVHDIYVVAEEPTIPILTVGFAPIRQLKFGSTCRAQIRLGLSCLLSLGSNGPPYENTPLFGRGEATWQAETEGARTWTKTGSRVDDSWAVHDIYVVAEEPTIPILTVGFAPIRQLKFGSTCRAQIRLGLSCLLSLGSNGPPYENTPLFGFVTIRLFG
ncbi:hypothetical protein V6N13_114167 [Hibiscus sabdariffa]